MGIKPTGKKFSLPIAIFYRFKDGKQAEAIVISDLLEWFRQIGVNPPPG
jgi:predicted ester cyclase